MARPGWNGVWAVGVVRARGGVGTHWQPFYLLGNASQVWVVGVVRARGGVGTHWQPTPRKCEPGLCSGEEMQARGVWAVGVVRARGGVGTHWQPLNTL